MKRVLAMVCALAVLALPMAGIALELTALPGTYQELMAMLPENQCPAPDDIEVFFNFEVPLIRVRCLEEDWPRTGGSIGGVWTPPAGPGFVYDPAAGEYVSSPELNIYAMVGDMNGGIFLESRPDENGWTRSFVLYFGQKAFENACWPEYADAPWSLVEKTEDTNYMMPVIVDVLALEKGTLSIVQYADRTEVALKDAEGNELESKVYPEYSELCSQYVLNRGE